MLSRTRFLTLLVMLVFVWLFFYYSFSLVNRLKDARAKANETIAWFWAGSQVPLSCLSEMGMVYVCSGCGATRPAHGFDSGSYTRRYCEKCGKVTKWYFVSLEGYEERQRMLNFIKKLFSELVERLEYPTVLTDADMMPQVVNGAAVDDRIPADSLATLCMMIRKMDRENEPIPIMGSKGEVVGYLHYGSDELERELLLVPYIELGLLVVIVVIFFLLVSSEIRKEKELAWAGFAKETAHQLGTPLSSLLGWLEILEEKKETFDDEEFSEAVDCMQDDISMLMQIAKRYGEMGKKPKLEKTLVNPVILDTVHYFMGRPAMASGNVELETDFRSNYPVMLNPVLFGWVIENLLKNAMAALKDRGGIIRISTRDLPEASGTVEIQISDNGAGIPFSNQKKIFDAGFTTRRGGWGLGLTLSKRIIEKYHGGKLRLEASSPGRGTTFVIHLPAAGEGEGEQ